MLHKRLLTIKLKERSNVFPIIVVLGARQVGKTTLLHEIFGTEFDYVVFDPILDIRNARSEPDLFLKNHKTPLILDEVQYVPELVAALKRKIDTDRSPGQYFLTGSQQWGILKTRAESLAGRATFLNLEGFSLSEIGGIDNYRPWLPLWLENNDSFSNFETKLVEVKPTFEQIWRGWLPQAQEIPLEFVNSFYQDYQRTYIERDIRLLTEISDWSLFGKFVQLAAAMSAQEINFSELGRELGISNKTSQRWITLLKGTFQWIEIPAFSLNSIKKVSTKPKGYLADTGSICSLQGISSPNVLGGHPLWGAIFETANVCEIMKQASTLSTKPNFYHWRSHSGAEVDLIIEWNGKYFPIEIKGTAYPKKGDLRGIQAFRESYPKLDIKSGVVLCTCSSIYKLTDNDYAFPWNLAITNK